MPTRYDHQGLKSDIVQTKTDILGDEPQRQAQQLLIPRIAKMSRNAIQVTPAPMEYFQRLKAGRRCSCFTVEEEPQGLCLICYGTGIVGGYQKRGTKLWVLDTTAPNVRAINVAPDYGRVTRPINWTLLPTAVYGYIETEIQLSQNVGSIDDLTTYCTNNTPQSAVEPMIMSGNDSCFVPLTEENLRIRLGQKQIKLRIIFRRSSPIEPLPVLTGIRLSYKLIPYTNVKADIPKPQESLTLEEFGIYESFNSQTFVFDNTVAHISTEDWVYNIRDGLKWKIIEVTENRPLGILTSWDTTVRLIQGYEPYQKVPLGKVLLPSEQPPKAILSIQQEQIKYEKDFTNKQQLIPAHPYNAEQPKTNK